MLLSFCSSHRSRCKSITFSGGLTGEFRQATSSSTTLSNSTVTPSTSEIASTNASSSSTTSSASACTKTVNFWGPPFQLDHTSTVYETTQTTTSYTDCNDCALVTQRHLLGLGPVSVYQANPFQSLPLKLSPGQIRFNYSDKGRNDYDCTFLLSFSGWDHHDKLHFQLLQYR